MLQHTKRRTRGQLTLFAIFTFGPLLALTVFTLSVSTNGLRKEVDKRLQAVASDSATLIETNTRGFASVVESYGQRPSIVQAVSDGKITPAEQAELEPVLDDLSRYHGGVTSVGIDTPDGTVLTSFPYQPALIGLNFSSRDWYKGASRTGHGYVSSAFISPSQGPLMTTGVAAPIRARGSSQVVGYIVAGYSLGGIEEHVRNVSKTLGVDLMVTDQTGTVVAQPGEAPTTLVSVSSDARVAAALAGESGVSTLKGQDGEILSAYAPVPGTGWTAVTEVSATTALSNVAATRKTIIGGATFIGIVLLIGLLFMARTLRQRAQVEAELGVARDAAQEASRLKSEFLANMSHEIRTPLNGVLGMTGLLLAGSIKDEERTYAEMAQRSGESLLGIINDILDFSKIEAGRLELESVDFELRDVVESAVDMFGEQAATKGLELTAAVAVDLPRIVSGDPTRLRQVLVNLVGNAMKFTQQGEVDVAVTCTSDDDLVTARFEVVDTGPGIAREHYEHLFESFTQADSSTTRQHGGTGLGLAISKQLVGLMGGEIGVSSEPGQGSTFWFTLPLVVRPDDALPGNASPESLAGLRILVVDDNATNRVVLQGNLSLWGAIGTAVSSGREGLDALREAASQGEPYAVVLIDHQMPEMDGIELARHVRADSTISQSRLVLLTSSQAYGSVRASHEVGVDTYLTKPVRSEALYRCIIKMLHTPLDASSSRRSGTEADTTATTRGHILVAEDNAINQQVAKGMLSRMGFAVDIVSSGDEAIGAHELRTYDIILMDVQMPGMDGCEATRIIRQHEHEDRRTPIIAMTAGVMKGDRERCLDAGMDDFLAKPVDWALVNETFAQWMPALLHPSPVVAPAETTSNTDLIDLRIVETLRTMSDEDKGLEALLTRFANTSRGLIEQLETALAASDTVKALAAIHSLKGSCATFGAVQLTRLSEEIEAFLQDGDIGNAQKRTKGFKRLFADTQRAYAETVKTPEPS